LQIDGAAGLVGAWFEAQVSLPLGGEIDAGERLILALGQPSGVTDKAAIAPAVGRLDISLFIEGDGDLGRLQAVVFLLDADGAGSLEGHFAGRFVVGQFLQGRLEFRAVGGDDGLGTRGAQPADFEV
jgi:hypothetical protein